LPRTLTLPVTLPIFKLLPQSQLQFQNAVHTKNRLVPTAAGCTAILPLPPASLSPPFSSITRIYLWLAITSIPGQQQQQTALPRYYKQRKMTTIGKKIFKSMPLPFTTAVFLPTWHCAPLPDPATLVSINISKACQVKSQKWMH